MLALPSAMGLFYSVLLVCLLFGYSFSRFNMLIGEETVDILTAINHQVYNAAHYTFNADDGLNFAVGLTAYDNVEENILDPSIAEI